MSERSQGTSLTPAEKMRHFGIHLGAWFISTSMAVGCGNAIYYLSQYEQQVIRLAEVETYSTWDPFVSYRGDDLAIISA